MPKEEIKSDITFSDCIDSVRYEIEDAIARFPAHRELFLFQVRSLLEKLEEK